MKLDKAIELNKESMKSLRKARFIDHADAVQIGNEAIDRVMDIRRFPDASNWKPLPGETED